jgi:predicted nucleic acid-binding protein
VIYADTSLLLPCYVPEEQSDEAQRIIECGDAIVASDITVAEMYAGLARKQRSGALSLDQMERSRAFFEEHLSQGVFHRVALAERHLVSIRSLSAQSRAPLRTLDSLHLAIASDLRAKMATFDRRLAEASRIIGLAVVP